MRFWLTLFISIFFSLSALAQKPDTAIVSHKDSLQHTRDSIKSKPFRPKLLITKVYKPDSLHSPHKAVIRSLILPGWGQVYNHRWWKVPIIYGGFVGLGLAIQFNLHYYNLYIKQARLLQNGQKGLPEFSGYSASNYQQFYDAAAANQRNFQLSLLGVVGVWGINCIDAYIDAKFKHSYTVDNDLSFKVTPTLINQPVYAFTGYGVTPGIKLTFTLK